MNVRTNRSPLTPAVTRNGPCRIARGTGSAGVDDRLRPQHFDRTDPSRTARRHPGREARHRQQRNASDGKRRGIARRDPVEHRSERLRPAAAVASRTSAADSRALHGCESTASYVLPRDQRVVTRPALTAGTPSDRAVYSFVSVTDTIAHATSRAQAPDGRRESLRRWPTSALLPLLWRRVDLRAGEVRLDPGKTKQREGRVFKLMFQLRQLLEERKAAERVAR